MKVSWGGIGITGGSGKLKGHVALKNNVVRVKVSPANPQTSRQIQQRARLSVRSGAWSSLTEEERLAWEVAASSGTYNLTDPLGNKIKPSGKGLYVQLNLNLATIGAAAITTPPVPSAAPVIVFDSVALQDDNTFSIAYTGTLGSGHTFVFTASPQVTAGQMKTPKSRLRFIQISTAATPLNVSAAYVALNGALTLGRKVFGVLSLINETTGQVTLVGTFNQIVIEA